MHLKSREAFLPQRPRGGGPRLWGQLCHPWCVAFNYVLNGCSPQPSQRAGSTGLAPGTCHCALLPSEAPAGRMLGACYVVGSWVPIQNLEVFSLKGGGGMVERVSVTPFLHLFSAEFLWFPLTLLPGWCVLKLPHQFSCMILLPSEQGAPFESGVKVTIFIRISYFPTYSSRNSKQHGNFMPLTHLH